MSKIAGYCIIKYVKITDYSTIKYVNIIDNSTITFGRNNFQNFGLLMFSSFVSRFHLANSKQIGSVACTINVYGRTIVILAKAC
jgi:hypothetical protein